MIRITTCESGDWVIVYAKNHKGETKSWTGHSIGEYSWGEIFKFLGHAVEIMEISDEDMENMC